MRRVAVFGAHGSPGESAAKAAVKKGLMVTALLQDSDKLPGDLEGSIQVVRGDLLNVEDVRNTLIGQDAVIVVLASHRSSGLTLMSEALKNIVVAMEALSIQIVSVCLSSYLFLEVDAVPEEVREVTATQRRMLRTLEDSDLLWVAVNPPRLTLEPASGYTSRQGQNTRYTTITQEDLGQFLVDCLSMPELYQKTVGVASRPRR